MSIISPYEQTANEPIVHTLIKKSFAFVPSVGMRLSPEILVLEFMREVFFDPHYGGTGARDLNADAIDEQNLYIHTPEERAVLHVLRGRRKKTRQSKGQEFFAPAYPQLARNGWLRKSSDRVINNLLLGGLLAQYIWYTGSDASVSKQKQEEIIGKIYQVLVGNKARLDQGPEGKEILSVTLGRNSFMIDNELATSKLTDKTNFTDSIMKLFNDDLANRITEDFISICDLEARLARMQWLYLFMTFLRFALPMWLLAHMQITRLVHSWLLEALDHECVVESQIILNGLKDRYKGLLHPTLTPTRELFEHIDRYMKCRVEINILLKWLEAVRGDQIKSKTLSLTEDVRDGLSLNQLLILSRDASQDIRELDRFKEKANGCSIQTFLTREAEQFSAWKNPRAGGQGKNIDEFFRVLYRSEKGDEGGGYLLASEGSGASRGFRVFPGQLLLKTMTFLAAMGRGSCQKSGGSGMLVLQDVEEHFAQYGIDFSTAADARPLLMKELQAMGLLAGSPDAGSSVAVECPY